VKQKRFAECVGRKAVVNTDVLIVGAGPSGLVLANLLARDGVSFRIVDNKAGPVKESRAAVVHVRTLELLDRLGLAGRALERGVKIQRVELYERGRLAAEFPLAGRGAEELTPFPFALGLEQYRTEELLVEGLEEHGGLVDWTTEFIALKDSPQGVLAVVRGANGTEEEVHAGWVVGADGASSTVRHALGLCFAGKTYEQTGLLADVEMDAHSGAELSPGKIRLNLTRGGFVGTLNLSDGLYRLFGAVPPGFAEKDVRGEVSHEAYASVGLGEIQRWFDEYFFMDARLKRAEWTSLYRIHSRMAERFRVGNVFLVGDAAHVHSPAGGQGMNLGIGDAFNLGWKVALVAKGHARRELLDSYEAERVPVGKAVLRNSDRGFMLEATDNPAVEWARANLATRLVGPLTHLPAVRSLVFKLFSQIWISYRGSSAVAGKPASRKGPHAGDRAPYRILKAGRDDGPQSVFDLIGGVGHKLVIFEGREPNLALDAYRLALKEVLGRYALETSIHTVPAKERELHELYGVKEKACLFLIRPDGHVGFVGSLGDLGDLATHMDTLFRRRVVHEGRPKRSTDHGGQVGEGDACLRGEKPRSP
jgi:2-polyprenyl-6-methoxyphenol hydroxylase-like FAD-dependent oxidoreductase